ncbi:12249_t:CDS:2, partial [Racocetra persica]
MTEDGPVKVDNMIFEFSQGITQSVKMTKLDYTEYKYEGKCKNKHENFLRKNLVAEGEISASVLSHLTIGLIFSYCRQISAIHHTEFSSEYEIILLPKYEIEIDVEKVQPSEDFIRAVNSALGSNNPKNELKKMSDNFGHYIASKVQIGGRINKIVHNNASSTLQQTSTDRYVGMEVGSDDIVSIGGNYSNKNGYNESLSTSNIKKKVTFVECINWEIIKYVDLISIFDILNLELRQKVLEAMGHKVLYSSIDSVDNIVMSSSKFSYEHKLSIPSELNLNLKECQIFASVMNKENMENVFSTRIIVYTSNNSASVVLHWINKSLMWYKTKFFNLQIGWVVVGQPKDFKFNENCDIIDSGKYAPTNNHQISIYDQFKDHSILVACTQQLPQQIDFHPKNSTLVTGVHFSCLNDSQLTSFRSLKDDTKTSKTTWELFEEKFSTFIETQKIRDKKSKISDHDVLLLIPILEVTYHGKPVTSFQSFLKGEFLFEKVLVGGALVIKNVSVHPDDSLNQLKARITWVINEFRWGHENLFKDSKIDSRLLSIEDFVGNRLNDMKILSNYIQQLYEFEICSVIAYEKVKPSYACLDAMKWQEIGTAESCPEYFDKRLVPGISAYHIEISMKDWLG